MAGCRAELEVVGGAGRDEVADGNGGEEVGGGGDRFGGGRLDG